MSPIRAVLLGSVVAAVAIQTDAQVPVALALDSPGQAWRSGGNTEWTGVAEEAAEAGGSVAEVRLDNLAAGGFIFDCHTAWLETTASGPGTVAIAVRHNHNPYSRLSLWVDDVPVEAWELPLSFVEPPGGAYSDWRRLTGPLAAGSHVVRIVYEFACDNFGTLQVHQPAVQADHFRIVPPLGPPLLESIDVPADSRWAAGGARDFLRIEGAEAQDGVDALRAPAVADDTPYEHPNPPWLRHDVQGPLTLGWWERSHPPSAGTPWTRRRLFVPPGPHVFLWTAGPNGQDFDAFTETTAPWMAVSEALESVDRAFTQIGSPWFGVRTPAAPDGEDAAWVRVTRGQDSHLETTVEGPATLSFRFSNRDTIEPGGHLLVSIADRPATLREASAVALLPRGRHRIRWTATSGFAAAATMLLDRVGAESAAEVSLADALDGPGLSWTAGPRPWLGLASGAAPDSVDAAVPPDLEVGESAWIETLVTGPGRLSFRWPLSDQAGYDSGPTPLRLLVDDRQEVVQSALQPAPVVEVGPGSHSLRWVATGQGNWRFAVLDEVRWTPLPASPRLSALDGPGVPLAAAQESDAFPVTDVTHDGIDALRLVGAAGGFAWQSSPSLTTWTEGPGLLYFWYKPAGDAALYIDAVPALSFQRDGSWRRGILAIPPGWRRLAWSVNPFGGDERAVWIDEFSFTPSATIPLDVALPGAGPWRTSPAAPWVGLPGDYILTTFSSAQAPASPGSWMETDVTGPAVVAFNATGRQLSWFVDGRTAAGFGFQYPAPPRSAAFIPPGTHTLRWLNSSTEAAQVAQFTVHPVAGEFRIESTGASVTVRVPRPAGFNDSQVSLQRSPAPDGSNWVRDYSVRIRQSEPEAVTFESGIPTGETRFWRAAYVVP